MHGYRLMFITNYLPGRIAQLNGENWLYFSGTSYLGMVQNSDFQNLICENIQQYGANFGGSRLSNLRLKIYEEAEQYLANWTGAEAALTVSSGSLAGQLVVKVLQNQGKFYFAPGVHPALFGEGNYSESPMNQWISYILKEAAQDEPMVLFSNALDPLRAKAFDFNWLFQIPKETPLTLVLDDSHGLGVTGINGAGTFSTLQIPENVQLIVISSLGKALTIPGGVILGSKNLIQQIWQSPYFGGASPVIPAYLATFLEAGYLYHDARQRLFSIIQAFHDGVKTLGLFENLANYPVFYTKMNNLAEYLLTHKILISSFPYPTPQDERITRVVLNAAHTNADIDHLVNFIKTFTNES